MSSSVKSVYFVSLGCPKNRVDTEVMLGLVDQYGHQGHHGQDGQDGQQGHSPRGRRAQDDPRLRIVGRPEEAEVIVVNTCGFIGEAKEESIDTILEMGRYKDAAEGRCQRLVVTGCLSQRYAGDLSRELPEVDVFLGSGDMARIVPAIVGPMGADASGPLVDVGDPTWLYDHTTPRLASTARHSAYVKIAEGCDRPCGFCIIPKLRGAQRSRTIDDIEAEVRALAEGGAVEVNLVAQDLTTYGTDLEDPATNLARLLRRLGPAAAGTALRWIRLHYAYPTATTDELLEAIAEVPQVARYVDVPIQHVDDELLKIMRRGYTGTTARKLVERVRRRVPGVTLRTTFIVGHPGETEAAFQRLCEFVEECEFDRVGVFTYSKEEGTPSAKLEAVEVPHKEAERRRRELMRLQRRISKRRAKRMVGREIEVLVDGGSEESEFLHEGRHEGQAPEVDGKVFLALGDGLPALRPGDLVRARVDSFSDYDLAATAVEIIRKAPRARGGARLPVLVG